MLTKHHPANIDLSKAYLLVMAILSAILPPTSVGLTVQQSPLPLPRSPPSTPPCRPQRSTVVSPRLGIRFCWMPSATGTASTYSRTSLVGRIYVVVVALGLEGPSLPFTVTPAPSSPGWSTERRRILPLAPSTTWRTANDAATSWKIPDSCILSTVRLFVSQVDLSPSSIVPPTDTLFVSTIASGSP